MPATDQLLPAIDRELMRWSGVSREAGRFNSTAYLLGKHEIGHIHAGDGGGGVADFGLPRPIRDELIAAGRAEPHHAGIRGAVSFRIRRDDDVPGALDLFRLNYDRLQGIAAARAAAAEGTGEDPARSHGDAG